MSDYDRDREPIGEPASEPIHDTERTTIIHTDSDRGRGGSVLIAVVLIIAVLALLFILFGGNLNRAADEVGVNVDVDTPKIDLKVPDVNINVPDNIKVELPDVDVETKDEGEAEKE